MTAYTDYTYYTNTYLGTVIASANFARLALRASAIIDQITFSRAAPIVTAATDTDTITAIKMAVCAVAEAYQTVEADGGNDAIQSESIGNNSVTYAAGASKLKTALKKYEDAASLYLGETGLMFTGFASGEYGGALETE
jgi:hypothetical protein